MKQSITKVMAVLVALFWFGIQQQSQSAPLLDQSFDSTGGDRGFAATETRELSQTFTANMTGYLVKVSLMMDPLATNNRPSTISIVETNLGLPTNTILWTGNYTSMADGWFDINITSGAPAIIAGTIYGIVLESTISGGDSNVWLTQTISDLYTGGKMYEDRGGGWVSVSTISPVISYPNADGGFRTYIDVVPEPSTLSFVVLAFVLTSLRVFRRRISTSLR